MDNVCSVHNSNASPMIFDMVVNSINNLILGLEK